MPGAEAFLHGTRARYVSGCRCADCRASNVRAYHERQARAVAAALEISAAPRPVSQAWTGPDGVKRLRVYTRACPGAHGQPCRLRAHLRKDSKGGVCRACRERLIWNGIVSADRARAHLLALSRAGIGRNAVAAASDISRTVLHAIRTGRKIQIRAATERSILGVDAGARADHSLVPARNTWRRVRGLLAEGFTRTSIARQLGSRAKTPALQLGHNQVLAITALKVERLFALHIGRWGRRAA